METLYYLGIGAIGGCLGSLLTFLGASIYDEFKRRKEVMRLERERNPGAY